MKKRPITDDDIQYLFESFHTFFPKYLNEELRKTILSHIREKLVLEFQKQSIYPDTLPTLRKNIESYIRQSIIPPGEMVGVI